MLTSSKPSLLRGEAEVLPASPQTLDHLPHHPHCPHFLPSLLLPLTPESLAPASLSSCLFLKQLRHSPTLGPLHRLLPLPGMLFPHSLPGFYLLEVFPGLWEGTEVHGTEVSSSLSTSLKSLFKCDLLSEAFVDFVT